MLKRTFERQMIPNGLEVCKKQLFYQINRMQNVEVNDEQIDAYLPQIMKQLDYLSKEDIIKRFVAVEFNRFLNYYKDAPDLNIEEKTHKEKNKEQKERTTKRKTGEKIRLKINIGERDGITPRRLLGIINEVVGDRTISVGDIEITNKFTFFDVFLDQANKIVNAFTTTDFTVIPAKGAKAYNEKNEYRKTTFKKEQYRDSKPTKKEERNTNPDKPWRKQRKKR